MNDGQEGGLRWEVVDWDTPQEVSPEVRARAYVDGPEYMADAEASEPEWMVPGMIRQGSVVILGADSKAGKSCFATALGLAVATGGTFLGHRLRKQRVLWAAYEETKAERLETLRQFGEVPAGFMTAHQPLTIDTYAGLAVMQAAVCFKEPGLLVIDPLYAAVGETSLATAQAARAMIGRLRGMAEKFQVTVLALHHMTKGEGDATRRRVAASHQLLATASMDLVMTYREEPDGARRIWLRAQGRGVSGTWEIRSTGVTDYRLVASSPGSAKIRRALEYAVGPVSAKSLAKVTGLTRGAVLNSLAEMLKSGHAVVAGQEGRSRLFAKGPGMGPTAGGGDAEADHRENDH